MTKYEDMKRSLVSRLNRQIVCHVSPVEIHICDLTDVFAFSSTKMVSQSVLSSQKNIFAA